MKKLSNLSIKNSFKKNFNIERSKKKNQSKLVRSQKLKCNKNKSKPKSKKKKIQKGNAAQLTDDTPTSSLSKIQSNNLKNELIRLDEQSCLTQIGEQLDYLKDFLNEIKENQEIVEIMDTLYTKYYQVKGYCEQKIVKLQEKIDKNIILKIMSLAIIMGNFLLFCLDKNNKGENITLKDIQLPSKIIFIIQTFVNASAVSSNSIYRSNFFTSKPYLTFSKLSSLHSILGLLDSNISYNTTPQSIGIESIQHLLEYEPIKEYNIHNILLLGLTIIILIISYIITKKMIIPIFDGETDYYLKIEDKLIIPSQNTITECCLEENKIFCKEKEQNSSLEEVCEKVNTIDNCQNVLRSLFNYCPLKKIDY